MNSIREEALNDSDENGKIKASLKIKSRNYKTQTLKTVAKNL